MDLIGLRSDKNLGIVRSFDRGLVSSAVLGERQRKHRGRFFVLT